MEKKKETIYLITAEGCPACKVIKEKLKDKLEKGEIIEVIIKTEEDFKKAEELNIKAVPTILVCEEGKNYCRKRS